MIDSMVKNVSEIIFRLGISNGMNINEISVVSEIPPDIVREILLNILDVPFGGIILETYGISAEEDVFELSIEELDERVIWKVDLSKVDRIPTENLDDEEKLILKRLMKDIEESEFDSLFCNYPSDTAVFVKGTSSETNEIFKSRHYLNIRRAFMRKKKILIKYSNEDGAIVERKATLAGVVFHSERQEWYLVLCLEDNETIAVNTLEIISISVLKELGHLKLFDLKEYLKNCFDLDSTKLFPVEVIFKNQGSALLYAKRRLSSKGKFTETENGDLRYCGTLSGIDEFKRWILGFGPAAKVIQPEWLAKEQADEWKALLENYKQLESLKL